MKLISFSLFGNKPKYTYGLFKNLELKNKIYKEWNTIVYYDESVSSDVLEKLKSYGVMLRDMTNSGIFPTSWRFLAANEAGCYRFIVRDSDSRINEREELAVKEWEESDKILHIMRDHPHHGCPIMAGMWGMKANHLDMMQSILNHQGNEYVSKLHNWPKQTDQYFLRDVVYKQYAKPETSLIHNSQDFMGRVSWSHEYWARDFPEPISEKKHFIGEIFSFDENGNEYREYQYKER